MKYSILIRKLIQASKQTVVQKKDIANLLKERCQEDSDIIRQMLMNAVCDPRFRIHILGVDNWTNLVKEELEEFASKLESTPNLNQEIAYEMMNNMLMSWFKEKTYEINRKKNEKLKIFQIGDKIKPSLKETLQKYIDNDSDIDIEIYKKNKEENMKLSWSGQESIDPFGEKRKEGNHNSSSKEEVKEGNKYDEKGEIRYIGHGYEATDNVIEVENEFLKNVPPSLIKLAKIIGRSSNANDNNSGKFLSASKSDISGITIGNNLNCVLPSEIALLAEEQTENIFYKNYVTKNLQLFASQSSSNQNKKHHEGPIIICLDTSISMIGEAMMVAKALTFALCIIAQRKKRQVIVVKYSNDYQTFFLKNIEKQKKELNEFLTISDSGGNDENQMFTRLFSEILPNEKEYQDADTLCISDFGWCPILEETMQLINKEKEKNMKFYALNINNSNNNLSQRDEKKIEGFYSPKDVCDSLWEYQDGICFQINK